MILSQAERDALQPSNTNLDAVARTCIRARDYVSIARRHGFTDVGQLTLLTEVARASAALLTEVAADVETLLTKIQEART